MSQVYEISSHVVPACYTAERGAPTPGVRITRGAARDTTIQMNAHIAYGREKLPSHPTERMWTVFKNTVLEKH
jgi:hypothetical protein